MISQDTVLQAGVTVRDALQRIESGAIQMAAIVDADGRLVGIVTDGDIRRGLLRGLSLDDKVDLCMNVNPTVAPVGSTDDQLKARMQALHIHHLPIVDQDGLLVDISFLDRLLEIHLRSNFVLLMVGGMGKRLGALTQDTPKPMLPVGGRPLLEIILDNYMAQGFHNFLFAVNYRGDVIEAHFGNGDRFGCHIRYIREPEPMGTAGALSLLPEVPTQPLIVSNGDLVHHVDLCKMLDRHMTSAASATMAVRRYEYQIPYGVVRTVDNRITGIHEKPVEVVDIAGGLYILSPDALALVPKGRFFDMPDLFQALISDGQPATTFPIDGYWLDIGQVADYERANADARVRAHLGAPGK